MKTIKLMGLFLSLVLVTTLSCENQLDLPPLGELNSETFYITFDDFEAASLAPYSTLLNLYYEQSGLGHIRGTMYPSDNTRHGGQGVHNNVDFVWLPDNGDFNHIYTESYKGIMRANTILNRTPDSELTESEKARFEAEAKFIRAYFYFLLARHWGTPPMIQDLITTVEASRVGNSQPGEVLDFVEQDLITAKNNLPDQWDASNVGRATSGAAQALLGKVYLYRQKYAEAVVELENVAFNKGYSLVENFGHNFDEDFQNNAESIFEIQFSRGEFNPWLPVDFGLAENQNVGHAGTARAINFRASCFLGNCAPGANGQGYGNVHATVPLQQAFEIDDPRITYTFFREGDDFFGTPFSPSWSITGATPSKYLLNFITYPEPPAGSNNERVIRLADVYLMLAEAELLGNNNVARAAELINMVRRRADPSGEILPDRSATSGQEEMLSFLMHERRVELAFEGHRYDDLVRWHNAGFINIGTDIDFGSTLANQNWNERHLLKPFPQRELDLIQELRQNPGY